MDGFKIPDQQYCPKIKNTKEAARLRELSGIYLRHVAHFPCLFWGKETREGKNQGTKKACFDQGSEFECLWVAPAFSNSSVFERLLSSYRSV